ncbi:MAG: hypothetical protein HY292_05140 [Planctomycetes bacterium]|nr:hypothetical protein [Planctomycetota bacterium]
MLTRTKSEAFQEIVELYRAAEQPWPATMRDVAAWAIEKKLWVPERASLVRQLADELARALRDEYFTDPQGRRVRAKHPALFKKEGETQMLWADIRDESTTHEHVERSVQVRRHQIIGDCKQLKTDVDSYNENFNHGTPIQLVLDFTLDVLEAEAAEL